MVEDTETAFHVRNAWFSYDRYVRHDSCSRCDRRKTKRRATTAKTKIQRSANQNCMSSEARTIWENLIAEFANDRRDRNLFYLDDCSNGSRYDRCSYPWITTSGASRFKKKALKLGHFLVTDCRVLFPAVSLHVQYLNCS